MAVWNLIEHRKWNDKIIFNNKQNKLYCQISSAKWLDRTSIALNYTPTYAGLAHLISRKNTHDYVRNIKDIVMFSENVNID